MLEGVSRSLREGCDTTLVLERSGDYAWLAHFEPFVAEWRLGGGLRAGILYTGVAVLAAGVGVVIAETLLSSSFTSSAATILAIASRFAFITSLLYKSIPTSMRS